METSTTTINPNPQPEDSHLRIAIEIWEALGHYRLSGEEWLVLNCIIRKTWGWRKKQDKISLSQFEKYTGLKPQYSFRALKKLSSKKIIAITKKDDSQINSYCFNKLYNTWLPITKKGYSKRTITKKDDSTITKKDYKLYPKKINTTTINTTINTTTINKGLFLFKEINPSYEMLFKNKTQRDSLDRLIKKYGEEWVTGLIKRLPEICRKPYAPRITTPYELETKLGQLKVFLQQEKEKTKKNTVTKL